MGSLAHKWLHEGEARGIQAGIQLGEAKGEARGKTEGKIEGKIEGKLETAKNMLSDNLPVSTISKYTGLSVEEISKINKSGSGA